MPKVGVGFEFDLKPFEKRLQQLGSVMSGRVLQRGMDQALAPVESDAKFMASKESGNLARSITRVVRLYKHAVVGLVGINPRIEGMYRKKRRAPVFYAHLVEFGARAHALGTGSRLERRSRRSGKPVVLGPGRQRGRVHPGARAKPFLRPAFDRNRNRIISTLASEMSRGIKQIMGG